MDSSDLVIKFTEAEKPSILALEQHRTGGEHRPRRAITDLHDIFV